MAHGQNVNSFHRPLNCTSENSAFVNRQIIRLIQFSCNCAFLDKEESCKKLVVLQLFCTQQMWHASRMKMVDFQPGWDSLNWCLDVKSKMSFFSEIPKYLRKENTWRFYLYQGLLICKSRANLIFQVLPDYIWFLWTFALKCKQNGVGWSYNLASKCRNVFHGIKYTDCESTAATVTSGNFEALG